MAKKQDNNAVPLIAGAVGFGVLAALLAMFYLNAKEAELKAKYEQDQARTFKVVVANQDLRKGQEIRKDLFSARAVPDKFVHDDALSPGDIDRYVGRALVTDLGRGKTLLKSFMDDDFPRDFSDVIPAGKRAMTISVDDLNSIGGFLRPGNRVDIFVNIPFSASGFSPVLFTAAKEAGLLELLPSEILSSIPGELLEVADGVENPTELLGMVAPDDVIIPVLQNVTVLAAGKDPYRETLDALRQPQRRTESTFSHITLEVDPQQAALITLAEDKGEIVTLLRNRNDQSASEFTTVGSQDLFGNAARMANAEKERASRATVAAGVDVNGNLVDADGNKILSAEQLAAAGYSVNENGQIVDKDGNVVNPEDLVIAADGTVMTKQQLAAAGLSVNENGQIIDKDGNVVSASDLVVAADGSVMTKEQLADAGLSINANGEIVDKNGKVISPEDMIVNADGKILTKEQLAAAGITAAAGVDANGNLVDASGNTLMSKEQLAAAGYSINENGQIVDKNGNIVDPKNILVDKDGNIVDPNDIIVSADGSVLSKEQLAAAGLSINENGEIVDKDGNVVSPDDIVIAADGSIMTKAQLAAAGLSINENGQVVDKNGNVVDLDDLITSPDGTVLSKKALAAKGLSVNEKGEIVDAEGNVLSETEIAAVAEDMIILGASKGGRFQMIIGGASEDGVAKSQNVSIKKETAAEE
jgi:Flp pilus assembly protein CpaB